MTILKFKERFKKLKVVIKGENNEEMTTLSLKDGEKIYVEIDNERLILMNFNGDLRIVGHHIAEKYLNYSGA
jgi:hypothetical protein